jgi:hypothetical protein
VIAHVAGVPLEELVPALGGAGTALLAARLWLKLAIERTHHHNEVRERA